MNPDTIQHVKNKAQQLREVASDDLASVIKMQRIVAELQHVCMQMRLRAEKSLPEVSERDGVS